MLRQFCSSFAATVTTFVIAALAVVALTTTPARADLLVANWYNGTISEYTNEGTPVNLSLVLGLNEPTVMAVSGSNLLVTNWGTRTIGQYVLGSTPGTISASAPTLISGLTGPQGIAFSGSTFYVADFSGTTGKIGKYALGNTTGTLSYSNPNFITGLTGGPCYVAVNDTNLFLQNQYASNIAEYDLSGALVNANLATVPNATALCLSGSDLYVTSFTGTSYKVGKYTLGATPGTIASSVPSLISGTGDTAWGVTVCGNTMFLSSTIDNTVNVYTTSGTLLKTNYFAGTTHGSVNTILTPEPSTLAIFGLSVAALLRRRRR